MYFPEPGAIKIVASKYGYVERREEASRTLFFANYADREFPTLINVFYTTRGVMTKLKHPKGGYNQLWRSDAYDDITSLEFILANPRTHTGKGYRTADRSLRGCAKCGMQKTRSEYSKNQWRKGSGESKCMDCVRVQQQLRENGHKIGSGESKCNESIQRKQECRVDPDRSVQDICRLALEQNRGLNPDRWITLVGSIPCDNEECENTSPTIRCSRCEMAYYCVSCRGRPCVFDLQDSCRDVNMMREMNAQIEGQKVSDSTKREWAKMKRMQGDRSFGSLLEQAQYIYQANEKWIIALELYRELEDRMVLMHEGTPPQWYEVHIGICRCLYEMGYYDAAIRAGMAAVEMSRTFPQVHKYIAMAYMAKGDLAKAIDTMKRAVLYEVAYDDMNKRKNRDTLQAMFLAAGMGA